MCGSYDQHETPHAENDTTKAYREIVERERDYWTPRSPDKAKVCDAILYHFNELGVGLTK